MSWIKDNKFLVGLGGGTLVGAILLYFVGSQGAARYAAAKEKFDTAAGEASGYERLALYPRIENKDSKSKALSDYKQSVESIQGVFAPYRPKEITNISSQEFTNRLLDANSVTRKAFEESGTSVPEPYFVGFERYKDSLAPANTTGVLDYELASIKKLMLALAKVKPTELKNLHRPSLPEENGQTFTPPADGVARSFPLEITFTGSEKSAREFLSAIVKPDDQYLVIRSLRITNMKKDPPKKEDAKFDKPAESKPAAGGADAFGGGFVLPGEEAPPAAAPEAAPAAPVKADSSRILAQVLGTEQVSVFIRLDLLQFLPVKKLP